MGGRTGKTRTALLEMRENLKGTRTAKSMQGNDKNIFFPVKCYLFKMSDESKNSESNPPGELSDAELNTSHK